MYHTPNGFSYCFIEYQLFKDFVYTHAFHACVTNTLLWQSLIKIRLV